MSSTQENNDSTVSKSYKKLARLYHFVERQGGLRVSGLEKFLELEGDINYQVPESSCLKFIKPDYVGNTVLHFFTQKFDKQTCFIPPNPYTCSERFDRKAAELLINHGANPAIKNQQGLTPIHDVVRSIHKTEFANDDPFMRRGKLTVPFINVLLSAHIRQENSTNPRDPYGISHFHAACMINDAAAVEFYLDNQVPIDEAVNVDSPMFPGYTPLHFVARLGCVEVAVILLSRDANLLIKDSKGMTPLHLAIERNMRINKLLNWCQRDATHSEKQILQKKKKYLSQVNNTESIIACILSKMDKATIGNLHLYPFYVMCRLKDLSFMETDINLSVNMDSPFWPGYTALHFAARLNLDTVKTLLQKGANIEAKDASGETPLDLCVGTYEIEDMYEIFCSNIKWQEILLSDGKTKLGDLLRVMRDFSELKNYIVDNIPDINSVFIPMDSPLWPGYTILHLAVILSKKFIDTKGKNCLSFDSDNVKCNELIEVCIRLGANVTMQDLHGSTPLHLALRRLDVDDNYYLIENHIGKSNPVDRDNLSHLHIACVMSNENAVKKLIDCNVNVNGALSSGFKCVSHIKFKYRHGQKQYITIGAGSTALHVAVIVGSQAIVNLLMKAGADLNARDANGLTALHLLFMNTALKDSIGEILLTPLVLEDSVANGLNYLHVAAYGNCPEAIEKFVRLGADVHSAILPGTSFNEFKGNTPLHMAVDNKEPKAAVKLMTHSANVFAKNSKDDSPIRDILVQDYLLRHFISLMNDDVEKMLIDKMGILKFHMACRLADEEMIRNFVENGENVNAQIHNDSKIWPGYTPLHIVFTYYNVRETDKFCRIIGLLLNNGADITIADAHGETSIFMDFKDYRGGSLIEVVEDLIERPYMTFLLESLKNTPVNSANPRGISLFHAACTENNVAVVERLLKLGVDVNQTVDYFSDIYSGFTPLHFATSRVCESLCSDIPPLRTVHLLLKYGANVHARDLRDHTPLHVAARYRSLFRLPYRRILWAGADPEATNIDGKKPRDYFWKEDYCYFCNYNCCFACETYGE